MVVLMREEDARRGGQRVIATVAGWGVSSDGKGGMTRPEVGGYQLAMRRAYERAGFGVETVGLFEGHGTGTQVGDATELRALSQARRSAGPTGTPVVVSSVKAMIGHTKAAAGVAGAGVEDDFQRALAQPDRFEFEFVVGHGIKSYQPSASVIGLLEKFKNISANQFGYSIVRV